jgi:hypothetical protein
MRMILAGAALLALGGSLSACNKTAEPAADDNAAIVAVPAENEALDPNAAVANEAAPVANEGADANNSSTEHGSTDHGSTDH